MKRSKVRSFTCAQDDKHRPPCMHPLVIPKGLLRPWWDLSLGIKWKQVGDEAPEKEILTLRSG